MARSGVDQPRYFDNSGARCDHESVLIVAKASQAVSFARTATACRIRHRLCAVTYAADRATQLQIRHRVWSFFVHWFGVDLDAIGIHCLAELYDCPSELINDIDAVTAAMREAVERMGAELVRTAAHQFTPHGVTVLGLLAESHVSIHTWPERGYVAVDAFTCGTRCQPRRACEYLATALHAERHVIRDIIRGAEGVSDLPTVESNAVKVHSEPGQ